MLEVRVHTEPHAVGLPLPAYETGGAAGMDLRAAVPQNEPIVLLPGHRCLVPTGLQLQIPAGYEGQIRGRSGLAIRHGIGLVNAPGTIDSDYRGEIKVILINWGTESFTISRGERIAQIVFMPVCRAELLISDGTGLEDTERSVGGFGSTGRD